MVTHRLSLSQYDQALATFNDPDGGALKIVILP